MEHQVIPRVLDGAKSPALREAVARLVERKYQLDEWATCPSMFWALPSRFLSFRSGEIDSFAFFHAVMPFGYLDIEEAEFAAYVPTEFVLGRSSRWNPSSVPHNQREELVAHLTHADRASMDRGDTAEYVWIRPLGLWIAYEGKNRVRFLSEMGVSHIPSCISVRDYPAPERIARYAVSVGEREEMWAVLDSRFVQRQHAYALAEEILDAYGVPQPAKWPSSFPAVEKLLKVFEREQQGKLKKAMRVDMNPLMERAELDRSVLNCSFGELKDVALNPGPWVVMGVACTASLLIFGWATHPLAKVACAIVFGACVGMTSLLALPVFRARVDRIERRQPGM